MVCLNNPFFEIIWFAVNIAFYGMEMKFVICGDLQMIVAAEDLGPVEIELFLTSCFAFGAIFGAEGMQSTIGTTFGIESDNLLYQTKWAFVLGIFVVFL